MVPKHPHMQFFTIGTFGLIIIQFYKDKWLSDTSQRKRNPNAMKHLGFSGVEGYSLLSKKQFLCI